MACAALMPIDLSLSLPDARRRLTDRVALLPTGTAPKSRTAGRKLGVPAKAPLDAIRLANKGAMYLRFKFFSLEMDKSKL